jgi:hypothetical protein
MNTKTFAQQSRALLIKGVANKLVYWGFNTKGEITEEPQIVPGGYSFRGNVFDDANVPHLWKSLKNAVKTKGIAVVVEEAAYTWFNRMMALKIMAKNQYDIETVDYVDGLAHTPQLLQQARQGQYNYLNAQEKTRLQKIIGDYNKDQEAFALLLIGYCHSNTTMQNVFGHIDDYTELLLPDNMLQTNGFLHLLNTTDAISDEEYKQVELIGWLYQFYISERKDEVFASFKKNKKAEAKDIPAATQIFTPNWIVKYMVQNTAGKIWLDKHPNSPLKNQMKYLVENENVTPSAVEGHVIASCHPELVEGDSEAISSSESTRHPELDSGSHPTDNENTVSSSAQPSSRAESRDENRHPELVEGHLISTIEDLTLIDPACGSGHILVEGFDLLYQMYMEEYYTPEEAVESILKNNLFGLDIDDRAAQLATFAILLKAAQYYRDVFKNNWLPNVYSFPEDTLTNWFTTKKYDKPHWHHLQGMQLAQPVTIEWEENVKNKLVKKVVTFKTGAILNENAVDLLQLYHHGEITADHSQQLDLFWGDFEKPYNYSEFFYAIKLLRQGKNLGSVVKLNISTVVYVHILETYHNWLLKEETAQLDFEEIAVFNQLKPYLQVFFTLCKKYTAVVANPPYMGQNSMNADLKNYINLNFPTTKSDLCTVFIEVLPNFTLKNGKYGFIVPPSWMFLSTYEKLRSQVLLEKSIDSLLHLSRGVFGADFGSMCTVLTNGKRKITNGTYFRLIERTFQEIYQGHLEELFLIAKSESNFKYKFTNYSKDNPRFIHSNDGSKLYYPNVPQANFSRIPGNSFSYWVSEKFINLFSAKSVGDSYKITAGIRTSNDPRFLRFWHEVSSNKADKSMTKAEDLTKSKKKWYAFNKGGVFRKWFGNLNHVIDFENDAYNLKNYAHDCRVRDPKIYFKEAITWSRISSGSIGFRLSEKGSLAGDASPIWLVEDEMERYMIMGFINTKIIKNILEFINPTLTYQVRDISLIPFEYNTEYSQIIKFVKDNIGLSKKDWDFRETSWDFKQSPLLNESTTLKQAYSTWQENVTQDFFQLHSNEEELNRIFIDIYGLQDELTPEVALKDITILQEELNGKDLEKLEPVFREKGATAIELPINKAEVISQFISYAIGLYMGRYRLDKPGLNIAHPNPTAEELAPYLTPFGGQGAIDEDAIIPLMGNNCNFPDDAVHLVNQLLDAIWGHQTRIENSNFIQECLNKDLEKFLVNDFYNYHCSMYKKKPIYWLFSSKNGAFQALVYMHRMNEFTAEKLRANYMLEHLKHLRSERDVLETNTSSLNTQQAKRLDQVLKDIKECEEYDLELKNCADAQIKFDLDDGVTANYELFKNVVAKIK